MASAKPPQYFLVGVFAYGRLSRTPPQARQRKTAEAGGRETAEAGGGRRAGGREGPAPP